eukprot:COSAG01_NODE_6455_length_3657_cov_2.617416_2_plen_52_part_00
MPCKRAVSGQVTIPESTDEEEDAPTEFQPIADKFEAILMGTDSCCCFDRNS